MVADPLDRVIHCQHTYLFLLPMVAKYQTRQAAYEDLSNPRAIL